MPEPPVSLRFYTRANCPLCDRMERMVAPLLAARGLSYEKKMVDGDPAWQRRYGQRIPVLAEGDNVVLEGRPGAEEVAELIHRLTCREGNQCP